MAARAALQRCRNVGAVAARPRAFAARQVLPACCSRQCCLFTPRMRARRKRFRMSAAGCTYASKRPQVPHAPRFQPPLPPAVRARRQRHARMRTAAAQPRLLRGIVEAACQSLQPLLLPSL